MNLNPGTFEVRLASAPSLTPKVAGRLLTTTEAAVHLGLTGDKLASLRHVDTGPDWVQLGRTIHYIPDDLNWWLEQPERVGTKNL